MITAVHEIIAGVLSEHGLDRRTCYAHVSARPPDGATIDVECSDETVARELKQRLGQTSAGEFSVSTLPADGVPPLMLVVSGVGDVRREASHPSELVSQVICGDVVQPLKREGDWVLARLDDGYIGWIRDWHLRDWTRAGQSDFAARSTHRIRANHATIFERPHRGAAPVGQLVVGTPVATVTVPDRGWVAVELAGGKTGFARAVDLGKVVSHRITARRLALTGMAFRSVPYLWGGTTPNGFDCSGLVQRIFRLHGVLLPRDSDMQARFGRERRVEKPSDLVPGDLLFFGKSPNTITHTGLVLPDGSFLHSYGQVIVNSLDRTDARFSERLASIWQSTRNPLGKPRS